MVQIIVNSEEIELFNEDRIAVSYQIKKIAELKDSKSNFTNKIQVPATKQNKRKLGFSNEVTSRDRRPYEKLPALIIQDGVPIVTNGLSTILSGDKEKIEIVILSGLADFFEELGDKNLSDLDTSDLDEDWSIANIQIGLTSLDGVVYSLINEGAFFSGQTSFLADYFLPGVYLKTIVNKIFNNLSFELEDKADLFSDDLYDKLIMPHATDYLKNSDVEDRLFFSITGDTFIQSGTPGFVILKIGLNQADPTGPPINVVEEGNLDNNYNNQTAVYIFSRQAKGNFKIAGSANGEAVIRIVSSLKGVIFEETVGSGNLLVSENFSIDSLQHVFLTGEQITIQADQNGGFGMTSAEYRFDASESNIPFGTEFKVSDNLPNIKQKDFLKSVFQFFGIAPVQSPFGRKIVLNSYDNIERNKNLAIDWSDKLDLSRNKLPTVSFDIGFSKENQFNYTADDVLVTQANSSIIVDDENLAESGELVGVEFAATREGIDIFSQIQNSIIDRYEANEEFSFRGIYNAGETYFNDNTVELNGTVWKVKNAGAGIIGITPEITSSNYEIVDYDEKFAFKISNEIKPRLLIADQVSLPSFQIDIVDVFGTPTNFSILNIPYFNNSAKDPRLGFDYIISKYYRVINEVANDAKQVTCYLRLTPNDVKELDQFIPIYIDYFGTFFYVEKIDKYIKGKSAKTTLIKF